MPQLTDQERLGTVLAGKYRFEQILGTGGMGVVFAATNLRTHRAVAVKLLHPEYARNPEIRRRFLMEAHVATGLRHPNVVDVLDMDDADDGTVYLVLEMLHGESLAAPLKREGRLSTEACATYLLPVMDALAAVHAQHVIHRDVKPANIFLHRDGVGQLVPKLLDFGIAKVRETGARTATGQILGTVSYMAPEQIMADPNIGAPADVWAMGVVWYRCLSGRAPFEGAGDPATLVLILQGAHTPLWERIPGLPMELAIAIERALRVDLSERWATMGAFAAAIRQALGLIPRASAPASAAAASDASPAPDHAVLSREVAKAERAPSHTNLSWDRVRPAPTTSRVGLGFAALSLAVALGWALLFGPLHRPALTAPGSSSPSPEAPRALPSVVPTRPPESATPALAAEDAAIHRQDASATILQAESSPQTGRPSLPRRRSGAVRGPGHRLTPASGSSTGLAQEF